MPTPTPHLKAIIFDIGGVVVGSPLYAINAFEYEREKKLPFQYLNVAITAKGHGGAFQRFERNELDLYTFYRQFGSELSEAEANNRAYAAFCKAKRLEVPPLPTSLTIDGRELFGQMMRNALNVDPKMSYAITQLRATHRFKIAALTNNFSTPTVAPPSRGTGENVPTLAEELQHLGLGADQNKVRQLFDEYIESAVVGLRKPDPAFYQHALDLLGVRPQETVFLDDIGHNLKAAQDLGILTIRVDSTDSTAALRKLSEVTGVKLLREEGQDESRAKL